MNGRALRSGWSMGVALVLALCERLRIPNGYRDLAVQVARYHGHCHRALELKPSTVLKVLEGIDAFRRPERFEQFLTACEARGGAYLRDRRLRHPESVSRVLFRTGIQMARDRQIWEDAPDCARRRADLAARLWSIVRRMDVVHGIAVRRLEQLVSDQR